MINHQNWKEKVQTVKTHHQIASCASQGEPQLKRLAGWHAGVLPILCSMRVWQHCQLSPTKIVLFQMTDNISHMLVSAKHHTWMARTSNSSFVALLPGVAGCPEAPLTEDHSEFATFLARLEQMTMDFCSVAPMATARFDHSIAPVDLAKSVCPRASAALGASVLRKVSCTPLVLCSVAGEEEPSVQETAKSQSHFTHLACVLH